MENNMQDEFENSNLIRPELENIQEERLEKS